MAMTREEFIASINEASQELFVTKQDFINGVEKEIECIKKRLKDRDYIMIKLSCEQAHNIIDVARIFGILTPIEWDDLWNRITKATRWEGNEE